MRYFSSLSPKFLPIRLRQLNVAVLRGFIPTAKQDYPGFALVRKIHAVALAFEYPQFKHALAHWLPVARKPEPQAVELHENPRPGAPVLELRYPSIERDYTI